MSTHLRWIYGPIPKALKKMTNRLIRKKIKRGADPSATHRLVKSRIRNVCW